MKKLFLLAGFLSMTMSAQSVANTTPKKLVINETTKVIDLDAAEAPNYKATGYTATYKGNTYPVYESSKGKKFIFMISKKSGKQYRKYID